MKVHIADTGLSNVVSVCHSGRRTTSGHGHWPGAGWAGACFLTRYLPSCRAAALLPPRFSAALLPPHSLLLLARLGRWSLDLAVEQILVLVRW